MRQKLGIAIAIVKNAEVILLDEPPASIPNPGAEFLQLLADLRGENKAVWMTTHDIFRAKEIADRGGIMVEAAWCASSPAMRLANEDLERLYVEYVSRDVEQAA